MRRERRVCGRVRQPRVCGCVCIHECADFTLKHTFSLECGRGEGGQVQEVGVGWKVIRKNVRRIDRSDRLRSDPPIGHEREDVLRRLLFEDGDGEDDLLRSVSGEVGRGERER